MAALRRYGLLVAGVLLLLVGLVLLLTADRVTGFGWTAYAPLSSTAFVPMWPTPSMWAGGVLAVIGLVTIAGWIGYRIGRDSRSRGA